MNGILVAADKRKRHVAARNTIYRRAVKTLANGTDPFSVQIRFKEQLRAWALTIVDVEDIKDFSYDVDVYDMANDAWVTFWAQVEAGEWDAALAEA